MSARIPRHLRFALTAAIATEVSLMTCDVEEFIFIAEAYGHLRLRHLAQQLCRILIDQGWNTLSAAQAMAECVMEYIE